MGPASHSCRKQLTHVSARLHVQITVVHNPLIHEAVEVSCEPLSMEWLWSTSPGLADFVHDLPAGEQLVGGSVVSTVVSYLMRHSRMASSLGCRIWDRQQHTQRPGTGGVIQAGAWDSGCSAFWLTRLAMAAGADFRHVHTAVAD